MWDHFLGWLDSHPGAALWAQGLGTVLTGFLALGAGVLAYLGATRQVRLQERQAHARAQAYRFRMATILSALRIDASIEKLDAEQQMERIEETNDPELLTIVPLAMPEDLKAEHWQEHAMLGDEFVRGVHLVSTALSEVIRFGDEMRGKLSNEVSLHPTYGDGREEPDGRVSYLPDLAIEQRVKIGRKLFEAVHGLCATVGTTELKLR